MLVRDACSYHHTAENKKMSTVFSPVSSDNNIQDRKQNTKKSKCYPFPLSSANTLILMAQIQFHGSEKVIHEISLLSTKTISNR